MGKVGLIAGEGLLPVIWAKHAQEKGNQVITIGITPETKSSELQKHSDQYYDISVGQLDRIITTFKEEGIENTVMLGKVQKTNLYTGLELDARLMKILHQLKEKNDDAILLALVNELEGEGIHILEQTTYMEEFMAQEGNLTPEVEVTPEMEADIKYGFKMAKEIGRLDIGQTVVVKKNAVIAVEAIEGTDKAILRGGGLAKGIVVAKVSKPAQDSRFDIPTVGLTTMKNLVQVGADALVVEANKTFFIEQEEVLKLAKDNDIAVLAMR